MPLFFSRSRHFCVFVFFALAVCISNGCRCFNRFTFWWKKLMAFHIQHNEQWIHRIANRATVRSKRKANKIRTKPVRSAKYINALVFNIAFLSFFLSIVFHIFFCPSHFSPSSARDHSHTAQRKLKDSLNCKIEYESVIWLRDFLFPLCLLFLRFDSTIVYSANTQWNKIKRIHSISNFRKKKKTILRNSKTKQKEKENRTRETNYFVFTAIKSKK